MPTAYAMRDCAPSDDGRVAAGHVRVPEHRGGCGAEHEVKVNERGHAFIDCDRCGPALVGSHYGWAASPGAVPLTPDEIAENELAKRDAEVGQNAMMRAMTDSFVKAVHGGGFQFPGLAPAPQPKSIVEQIAEMSPADRAALVSMLAPTAVVTVTEADEPGTAPVATKPPTAPRVATSSAPVKRGPGRPPKPAH